MCHRTDIPRIEFLWAKHCPHVDTARARLAEACKRVGFEPSWTSWNISSQRTPSELRRYGSPTILVNGEDVAGWRPAEQSGACCRVYSGDGEALGGAPDVETICRVLRDAVREHRLDTEGGK